VALVTGSSRGIGRATALRLARMGADLAVNYRSDEVGARGVVAEIEALGRRSVAVQADVSQEEGVTHMGSEIESALGPITILVNNAGTTSDQLILRMSVDQFDQVIATNLRSAFLCSKMALRSMMKARWGRVVSVSSISGLTGQMGQANYAASKAGLIALTKSIAREVGSRNITANAVAPGFIPTELTSALGDEWRDHYLKLTPLGRFGEAEEVAATIAFLCSPEAGFITGQTIAIDGGISMM
jgi:3-oxoacyl-[acyl-carrier protein] reductase